MNNITVANNQTNPQTQDTIEEAVQEALLAAEFFGLVPRDPSVPPSHLPANASLDNYLEPAEAYADIPVGMDELIVLARNGGSRR